MKKRDSLSAAEFVAQLQGDSEYLARQQKHEEELAALAARRQALLEPMLSELSEAGYPVTALDEVAMKYAPLPLEVSAILLRRLVQIDEPVVQEQIVRALGAARGIDGKTLVDLFERTSAPMLRWAIANTLAEARPAGVLPWLRKAVRCQEYADARQMLPLALVRLDEPEAANVLLREVLDEMPGHVALAWAESGGIVEREMLLRKRGLSKDWERREIDRAVRAIERRIGR